MIKERQQNTFDSSPFPKYYIWPGTINLLKVTFNFQKYNWYFNKQHLLLISNWLQYTKQFLISIYIF